MNLKLAEAIMHDFGKFLELSNGTLMQFFMAEIPETLLPYPKEKIEEALTTALKHFSAMGNEKAAQQVKTCLSALLLYTDDYKAIESAAQRMQDTGWKEKLTESRRTRQKQLFEELEKRST